MAIDQRNKNSNLWRLDAALSSPLKSTNSWVAIGLNSTASSV